MRTPSHVLYCHLLIHAEIYIYMLDTYRRNELIRRSNKRRRKTSLTIFTSHVIARVRKGCVGFYCERELETEKKLQYFDPTVMTVTLCLSCSLGLLNRRPRAHSGGCWLSLLHLIIFSGPQTPSGFPMPPPTRLGVAFPTTSPLQLSGTLLATPLAPLGVELNWII